MTSTYSFTNKSCFARAISNGQCGTEHTLLQMQTHRGMFRRRYCFLFFVAAHAATRARGSEVDQSHGPEGSASQATPTSQMRAYITPEASVLCRGKAFGSYPHPTDKACQITCYGSDGQPGSSDAMGHKECCSPGLCYSPASDPTPASCAPCPAGQPR